MKDVSTTLSFYQKPKSSVEIRDAIKKQIKSKKKENGEEEIEIPITTTESQSGSFMSKKKF